MSVPDDQPHVLEKLLFAVFALFLVSSTFSIALAQISLGLSLLLFIPLAIVSRHQPFVASLKWFYLAVLAYVVWLAISALSGATPLASLRVSREEWMFAVVPIAVLLLQRDEFRSRLMRWFAIAVGVVSIYAVVQYVTGKHWFHFADGYLETLQIPYPSGNFSNPLTFGNYYATAGLLLITWAFEAISIGKNNRRLGVVAGLLAIIATVLTQRRGPLVAVIVGLLLYAAAGRFRKRWLLAASATLAALSLALLPSIRGPIFSGLERDLSKDYEGSRVFIWSNSLSIIEDHPLFGVGQGNFPRAYVAKLRPDIPDERKHAHAHNDILNMAAVAGIPGGLVFTAMWIVLVAYLWRGYRKMSFSHEQRACCLIALIGSVTFFVTSLSECTFADDEVRQMLMFVWAFGLAAWYRTPSDPVSSGLTSSS